MELAQEWIEKGFGVSVLQNGATPYYQLFHEDLFGLHVVGGSRSPRGMNELAKREWERMAVLKRYQEDDGEID